MKRIISVFGTRPEAIKMAPVINALAVRSDAFVSRVCVTAQHRRMLDQVLELFAIRPDYDLDIMRQGQSLTDITCNVLRGLAPVIEDFRPDLLLVHGDTTTTMAAGLAACYHGIQVGHVEAGLRTGNKRAPFPEEINRRVTGVIADLHFAPTETARHNLLREGVPAASIFVTGNTVIDALLMTVRKIEEEQLGDRITADLVSRFPSLVRVFPSFASRLPRLVLVTGHRRENFGRGFENICQALKDIADRYADVEIVYPVHLNPNVQAPVRSLLSAHPRIHLIDPLDYLPFVYLMIRSTLIITDSGGIQEEAPALGKPVLVTRETTERPEVLTSTTRLVGPVAGKIVAEASALLAAAGDGRDGRDGPLPDSPYGDGRAALRIADVLADRLRDNR